MDILGVERNFSSLSTRDLLAARDLYHWHLTHKRNVVGTAVGLYYIRTADPWPSRDRSYRSIKAATGPKEPRTFSNSEVRDYSWPCVLVLVDDWAEPEDFGTAAGDLPPEDMVPTTLYLPDGRTVPVCVVKVQPAPPNRDLLPTWTWPETAIGGGFPLTSSTQGEQNIASVGTLVTDGHTVYALTSRHVAGPLGHPVGTIMRGKQVEVGTSSARQVTRLPFTSVYADFPGTRTYLTLDAGLVEVNDAADWTSQTYGLPQAGDLADLSELNIGMRLINADVVAFGAASGLLHGKIAALFLRYKSMGGYDDVTDFLIAPSPGSAGSQPGDSGSVWYLVQSGDPQPPLRPLALQWGGQGFLSTTNARNYNFALAASLTNVLRLLEVDLVVDHNTHAQPFWGKTGHYSIASFACDQVTSPRLKALMGSNVDRISFTIPTLDADSIDRATKRAKDAPTFIPLADVPDLVWKNLPHSVPGGRDTAFRTGPEHPTHFADIDEPNAEGVTLRQLCIDDPTQVTVNAWQGFYTALGHTDPDERGLLPLRVWQFYDAMLAAVEAGDATRFVGAAGLMAHYVGDACQPLHGSVLADGFKDDQGNRLGAGVHSAYETYMVDDQAPQIIDGLTAALAHPDPGAVVGSGQAAAVAIVQLMDRTAQRIDPTTLVRAYADTQIGSTAKNPTHNKTVTAALWAQFGDATIANMADGVQTLAMLWQSAWTQGGGEERFQPQDLIGIDLDDLRTLYESSFVESLDLDHIGDVLT